MFLFFIATGGMIKHQFNLRKHLLWDLPPPPQLLHFEIRNSCL